MGKAGLQVSSLPMFPLRLWPRDMQHFKPETICCLQSLAPCQVYSSTSHLTCLDSTECIPLQPILKHISFEQCIQSKSTCFDIRFLNDTTVSFVKKIKTSLALLYRLLFKLGRRSKLKAVGFNVNIQVSDLLSPAG